MRLMRLHCIKSNAMRMMLGMIGTEDSRSGRLIIPIYNNGRVKQFQAWATVGESFCRDRQSQAQYNETILKHSRRHRLYTHAHAINKRGHTHKAFQKTPLTKNSSARGLFDKQAFHRAFMAYLCQLDWRRELGQFIDAWKARVVHARVDCNKADMNDSRSNMFQRWELSKLEVIALKAGIQTCRAAASKQGATKLTWTHIPLFRTHFNCTGPLSFVWYARMAQIQPQHLALIGANQSKVAQKREIELLKTKLNAVTSSGNNTLSLGKRTCIESKTKLMHQLFVGSSSVSKHRQLLSDLYQPTGCRENIDVPHYSTSTLQETEHGDRVCSMLQSNNATKLHSDSVYRKITTEVAGQRWVQTDDDYECNDDTDHLYRIPDRICNLKRSRKLMQHANNGTLKPEYYTTDSQCRTVHDGITYVSGTTTFGSKQQYCRAMLLDSGCDFNIASAWYLRDMLGPGWKKLITPIPGHTVTARMATGHASQAIGTIVMEVTFAVARPAEHGSLEPMISVNQLVEGSEHSEDTGWSTTTKLIEYLVFEGIDLPIINGAPFLSHILSDISFHDQAPTHARMYDDPYVPGRERELSNQYIMVRRRRTAPVTQLLVCCAQKDTWISTKQPQAILVDIPGCGQVAGTGVYRDGEILNEEPGLDAKLDRVPLQYLMDTVQPYGQISDAESRFITHPESRYLSSDSVNDKLQSGTFEVVVQGLDSGKRQDETVTNQFYHRHQDEVIVPAPADINSQCSGVYIKAGTAVAILEVEAINSVINAEIPEHKRHRGGGCNHILDDRFVPAKVHRRIIPDGKAYTIYDGNIELCQIDAEVDTACGTDYDKEHVIHCTQPDVIASEMRRYVAELSAEKDSTKGKLQAQAIQDLSELLPHIMGGSLMSIWAATALEDLVTGTLLQTTRIHRERLLDRCRAAEAYRLFIDDQTKVDAGRRAGLVDPTPSMRRYRGLVSDAVSGQLKADLRAVVLRMQYMEQLKETLRTDEWLRALSGVRSDRAQNILQLVGTAAEHQQADDATETMAAQLQGLLSESLPPRSTQDEKVTQGCKGFDAKHQVTKHDRMMCSVRSAHDEVVGNSPDHVYVDVESGVARIHYVAAEQVMSTANDDGYRVSSISEATPADDPRLVASIADIDMAIGSIDRDEGGVCHIAEFTRGNCCQITSSSRNKPPSGQRRRQQHTSEERDAVSAAGKQREEIMEFINRDSEYQNPLESVLESTFHISPMLVDKDHAYHNWPEEDKMVSCEDVLDIISAEYRTRIEQICKNNAPAGASKHAVDDRAKRFAGYLASTELPPAIFTPEQQQDLVDLILDGEAAFNCDPNIPPCWRGDDWDELKLRKDAGPITHRERPIPPLALPIILKQIKKWLEAGICVPSKSPHNSPLMAVVKKPLPPRRNPVTGVVIPGPPAPLRWRVVVDYSLLNRSLMPVNMAGAPRLDTVVHQVGSCGGTAFQRRTDDPDHKKNTWYCSTTDLMAGFHQSTIAPECRDLTAFIVPGVLGDHSKLEFVKAPFGTRSMPTYFSRLVGSVLSNLHFGHLSIEEKLEATAEFRKAKIIRHEQLAHEAAAPLLHGKWKDTDPGKCVCHYIDDAWCVTMTTWDDHITALRHLFHKLALYGLGARADKSEFAQTKLGVLGWQVSEGKVHADMGKVHKMIDSIGGPDCILKERSEVQTALGSVNFYRTLIPNSGGIAHILYNLTKKDAFKKPSDWTPFHTAALRALKEALLSDSFLAIPDERRSFFLMTDSSSYSVGAAVAQLQADGSERPVSYASSSLPTPARRWGSSERELFAIIHFLDVVFRHLLVFCEQVHLVTDHKSLEQMVRASRSNNSKLARWIGRLAMWRNASVTFRAGVLVGPADMLSRLTESRSAAEMAALIPDSHKPVLADRGDTAHLETGESGPTDSIRAVGLPMQRLAMLKPPSTQQFGLAQANYDSCTDVGKDLGLCAKDPLRHANDKGKHEFDGLVDWMTPGPATVESCKRLIHDDIPLVAAIEDHVRAHQVRTLLPKLRTLPGVDPNDTPTATGSTAWHRPHGREHADWTRFVRGFALKHPCKDRDLTRSEIYFVKVLDTRPIDNDYVDYYGDGAEVKLRGDGKLREMIIGWTEYETIPVADIIQKGNPGYVIEQEEIVYSAHVRDSSWCQDGQFNSVRNLIQTDDDYDSSEDDGRVNAMQDYVDYVMDKLGGPVIEAEADATINTVARVDDAFPDTLEGTINEVERLMFVHDSQETVNMGSVHNVVEDSECSNELIDVIIDKREMHYRKGTPFSKSFLKRVVRRVSANNTDGRVITRGEIDSIIHLELDKCVKTSERVEHRKLTEDSTVFFAQEIEDWSRDFGATCWVQTDPINTGNAAFQIVTRSDFRAKLYHHLIEHDVRNQCNATLDARVTPEVVSTFGALYTDKERMQWKEISAEVCEIAADKISQVAHLDDKESANGEMMKYIEALCEPDTDTVVCQGLAGSGKTFTAMLCAFLALRKGLLEEVLHTRPLVSAGGVGIGFEPGSVGQKLSFWSKPMADAFKRLNLDEDLKDKVSAYPFDRIRGVSMRPRTWLLGDEAQNMNYELLKCLINRTEKHSKFVATGDVGQSDITLKGSGRCGLKMILDGIAYKKGIEDDMVNGTAKDTLEPNDKDYVSIQQLGQTMKVIELQHSLRNPDGTKVRQWLEQLPAELKKAAKLASAKRITNISQQKPCVVPVFASFAGVDNLGNAVCQSNRQHNKYKMRVVGGSEVDAHARAAFRRRNGFEPMYENEKVTSVMLEGIYVIVSGAPCVAYSMCGSRRGLSAKLGRYYVNQIDAYTQAEIPVIILEQVPGAAEIQPHDEKTQFSGITAQQQVEDKLTTAGYHVERKVVNAADYGGAVSRERMITVAVRNDLHVKKQFEWPEATVSHESHRVRAGSTVRQMLDPIVQVRYLLPQRRMHEFEEKTNSGSSRARKLYHRLPRYQTEPGIGNPYDPNAVYSLDGPAPSPTARGNSRYFLWTDPSGREHFRRLNPREMARCMGVPLDLIKGLNDIDAYRLVGNSVSEAMSAVIGPIARSLIDPEILKARLELYKKNTPVASRSKTDDSSDVSKNGVVSDCLHIQMWNRITNPVEVPNRMVEDIHARSMMPTHPDNSLNEEGQVHKITGCFHKPGSSLNEEGQDNIFCTITSTGADILTEDVEIEAKSDRGLNEEGNALANHSPPEGLSGENQTQWLATIASCFNTPAHNDGIHEYDIVNSVAGSPRCFSAPARHDATNEHDVVNSMTGCTVDRYNEQLMVKLQESQTDSELNIGDCIDGGINLVSDAARLGSLVLPLDKAMFNVVERQCNFVRLDTNRQRNTSEIWETIRTGQKADPEVKAVHDHLMLGKAVVESLQEEARQCHVLKGIVYRIQEDNHAGPMLRLWVPKSMQDELVLQAHQCALVCHPTEVSMKRTIERRYFWPSMGETCRQIVKSCDVCERARRPPGKHGDRRQIVPISRPMSVVAMDVVGPMGNAKSATSGQNRFIVSFIDWFSRFSICYAVANTDAETIGDCITKFTQRLGTPLTLISDNATYFTDAALSQYERRMGIKHSFVAAFRPEGNGLLERFHSILGRSMKIRAATSRSINWDKELDSITFAYNIAEHGVTGYSPFYLLHGWHPTLPFDITAPATESEYGSYSKWVAAAAARLRTAHDCAYRRMTAAQIDRIKKNNSTQEPLKAGDKVYLWVPSIPRGAVKKLTLRWHGPYEVVGRYNGTRKFEIQTQRGIRVVHEHRIRKSWTDERFAVSKHDDSEFEELLDNSGRVDGIFAGKQTWSEVMKSLLETDPYEITGIEDMNMAGDTAVEFDLAYIFGKNENWCQTTESARAKSREPDIDHTIHHNDTTQEDQMQQAAEDLVNQQNIAQHSLQCRGCERMRSGEDHHSVCWHCWYSICLKDERVQQASTEIPRVCGSDIVVKDALLNEKPEMVADIYYRLALPFINPDDKADDETVPKCILCRKQNILVGANEIAMHCDGKGSCHDIDTRENLFTMNSAQPHVMIDNEGKYTWVSTVSVPSEELEDDEILPVESIDRNEEKTFTDHELSGVCGIEPYGSQYRVKWTNYKNKPRGEVCKLQYMLNSDSLVSSYLQSKDGKSRMSRLGKLFQANAPLRIQKSKMISTWNYREWYQHIRDSNMPHKFIYRVVVLKLQRSGKPTQESFVRQLKEKREFPELAKFTAWIIPYGFRHHNVGSIVIPVTFLSTQQVSLLFAKADKGTMTAYCDQLRTSMDKDHCTPHWVHTAVADAREDIIRSHTDEQYAVHNDFYTTSY